MKGIFILLTVACFCHTVSAQSYAAPVFKHPNDGPYNVSVTEGESVTFNCNPFAKPQANIVWLQNGHPIDTNNPPERFAFSNNKRSLTIRDVCRDCVNQERQTDLMVIQCNASNVHGYAFASGYLKVLFKTKVSIRGATRVFVDFREERQFVYQCYATSDPSTPPSVRWYKTEPFHDLVRSEPPYVNVTNEFLIITIDPSCSAECVKYLGEYRCIGDNGYSRENETITLYYQPESSLEEGNQKGETRTAWIIILGAGAVGLVLLLIGIFLPSRSSDVNRSKKDKKLPNPPAIHERSGYDSVNLPLETIGHSDRSMRKGFSMYEQIGYASMDQLKDDMALRKGATLNPDDIDDCNRYESIDVPRREAMCRGRPMVNADTIYDDTGLSIPLEEVANDGKMTQQQIHESVQSESGKFPTSNEQSESMNTYSDLGPKEVNLYSDLGPKEVLPHMDLDPKEENPYSDLGPKEVTLYSDLGPKEVIPHLDLGPKKVKHPWFWVRKK